MWYLVKTPWWLKKLYPSCVWDLPANGKKIYLTFDDGPHPEVTPFVLDQLKKYNAKATFFCIGKNAAQHPGVYKRILEEGHAIGNHSFNHLNGWHSRDKDYFDDIIEARKYIDSKLFRPPYGKITRFQLKYLQAEGLNMKVIMWTVISGDFDDDVSPEKCYRNVADHIKPGRIIVFHDSDKAAEKLTYALPGVLEKLAMEGYDLQKISI
jgi:peptidoglycan-N-acetylglucosamine deacetylase